MQWESLLKRFGNYLRLERGLSQNTLEAYQSDLSTYISYLKSLNIEDAKAVTANDIQDFLITLIEGKSIGEFTQARKLSALRQFHEWLITDKYAEHNPLALIQSPKLRRSLPTVLRLDQIEQLLAASDLNTPLGLRNRAMLELLYSSGLRVSELVNLPIQHVYPEEGFVRVTGKGSKERLVPVGEQALFYVQQYLATERNAMKTKKGSEGILFLNRLGARLTRVMAFTIIRQLCKLVGITQPVGPHTFRHSFATHLIEGGADLRAVQEMLGHESITTTEVYLHLDRQYLRQVHEKYHPRS